jgi:hypothetical protein
VGGHRKEDRRHRMPVYRTVEDKKEDQERLKIGGERHWSIK